MKKQTTPSERFAFYEADAPRAARDKAGRALSPCVTPRNVGTPPDSSRATSPRIFMVRSASGNSSSTGRCSSGGYGRPPDDSPHTQLSAADVRGESAADVRGESAADVRGESAADVRGESAPPHAAPLDAARRVAVSRPDADVTWGGRPVTFAWVCQYLTSSRNSPGRNQYDPPIDSSCDAIVRSFNWLATALDETILEAHNALNVSLDSKSFALSLVAAPSLAARETVMRLNEALRRKPLRTFDSIGDWSVGIDARLIHILDKTSDFFRLEPSSLRYINEQQEYIVNQETYTPVSVDTRVTSYMLEKLHEGGGTPAVIVSIVPPDVFKHVEEITRVPPRPASAGDRAMARTGVARVADHPLDIVVASYIVRPDVAQAVVAARRSISRSSPPQQRASAAAAAAAAARRSSKPSSAPTGACMLPAAGLSPPSSHGGDTSADSNTSSSVIYSTSPSRRRLRRKSRAAVAGLRLFLGGDMRMEHSGSSSYA